MFMQSFEYYFGAGISRCFATWDMNAKISLPRMHKQVAVTAHTLSIAFYKTYSECLFDSQCILWTKLRRAAYWVRLHLLLALYIRFLEKALLLALWLYGDRI